MKAIIFILINLLSCYCILSQQKVDDSNLKDDLHIKNDKSVISPDNQKSGVTIKSEVVSADRTDKPPQSDKTENQSPIEENFAPSVEVNFPSRSFAPPKNKRFDFKEIEDRQFTGQPDEKDDSAAVKREEKFHWKPAMIQSGIFLGIQHAFRLTQGKTSRELDGPFFRDWGRSVRSLNGWSDGNKFFTNYVAHPLQGGVTGRIFINNSDRAKRAEFGKSLRYWETRLKALAWSAVWSTQFELGPVSEATIGNVGINGDSKYNKMAWVDLVVTPVAGTGIVVAEDALDKYVLKNWLEKKNTGKNMVKFYRVVFTPTYSVSNLLRGKMPWHRDDRSLRLSNNVFPGN